MSTGVRLALGAVALILALSAAAAAYLWKRPLRVFAWFNARALARAGLTRTTVESPIGPQVFWTGGRGPTLVLIHGAGDGATSWAGVVPALAPSFRLVVPSLAGHESSAPATGALSVGQALSGLEAVLDATGGDPATLVGNSLGAWVAMLYARAHPSRVARLVLVNGGAIRGERTDLSLMPKDRREAARLVAELRDPGSPPVPGFVLDHIVHEAATGPIARLYQTAASMDEYLLDGHLDEVRAPVDLLWGASDKLFPTSYAERLAEGLPASRLTLIPGCGHVPHVECPARFAKALLDVLGQAPPARETAR